MWKIVKAIDHNTWGGIGGACLLFGLGTAVTQLENPVAVWLGLSFAGFGVVCLVIWLWTGPVFEESRRKRAKRKADELAEEEARAFRVLWEGPCHAWDDYHAKAGAVVAEYYRLRDLDPKPEGWLAGFAEKYQAALSAAAALPARWRPSSETVILRLAAVVSGEQELHYEVPVMAIQAWLMDTEAEFRKIRKRAWMNPK